MNWALATVFLLSAFCGFWIFFEINKENYNLESNSKIPCLLYFLWRPWSAQRYRPLRSSPFFYFSRSVIFSVNGEKCEWSKMEICLCKRPPRSVNTSNNWHNEVSLIMQQLQQLCSQSDCNKLRQKHVCRALWLIDSNFNWIRQINIQFATANGMFRGLVAF